jgi:hypothetical protein
MVRPSDQRQAHAAGAQHGRCARGRDVGSAGRTPGADCRAGTPALLGTYRVKPRLREPQAGRKLVDGARAG